jgi:hypothetical protein
VETSSISLNNQTELTSTTSTPTSKNACSRFFCNPPLLAASFFCILPDQSLKTTTSSTKYASVPTVSGDNPVMGWDPSGELVGSPDCPTVAADECGSNLAGDATGAAGIVDTIGAIIRYAWEFGNFLGSTLGQASAVNPAPEWPIWFGQVRISPKFSNGIPITVPTGNFPIKVFADPAKFDGVWVAINNRTLANYSLRHVRYPPIEPVQPTQREIDRLDDNPVINGGSKPPSRYIGVTPNQDCKTLITSNPSYPNGIITSNSYAQGMS